MKRDVKGLGLSASFAIFGMASLALFLETRYLIPSLSARTELEPVLFWFSVAGLGIFIPLLLLACFILKREGLTIGKRTWQDRLRFKKMSQADWLWSTGAILIIGISSFAMIKLIEIFTGTVETHPSFMYFEPLTRDRYWILLVWLPYWLLNIMGEEICWRGVILPRQEIIFGNYTWAVHGLFWGIFHIAFGWQLVLTLLPILFIQSYVVQKRKNSWTGVVIHAVINGPSFIAIAFGLIK